MRKFSKFVLGLSLAVTWVSVSAAQEKSIPKVLQIQREYLKPGRAGMLHQKAESAFVNAMARAKWPTHYFAMTSLSGKTRALFLTSYDSLEAWEKDAGAVGKNAALSAALDHAYYADGELLESADQGVFLFREEMSLRPRADLSQMRFMEALLFHVRPGKNKEWGEVVKMAKAGYEKGVPESHWGMFEEVYGGDGGTFLLLISHKSLAEIDKGFAADKDFAAAIGEEGMKKLDELFASSVESTSRQLFAFSPEMSYPQDEWIKADPDYWKPKAMAAAKAPPAEKPAAEKKDKP
jgi:hypothetical protein